MPSQSPTANTSESHNKPCTLCTTPRPVLVRCKIDSSAKWHFVCPGKCWTSVSGGNEDAKGHADDESRYPYYVYGGMWKNRHADGPVSAGKPGRVKRRQQRRQREAMEREKGEAEEGRQQQQQQSADLVGRDGSERWDQTDEHGGDGDASPDRSGESTDDRCHDDADGRSSQ